MSSLNIVLLNLRLVMLETAYARLEARFEARFEGGEAATEQPVRGNPPDVNHLQPVVGGNTIPRPSPQEQPNSWVLSAGSVTAALVLHFTRGNTKEARLLYSAIGRLARQLVQLYHRGVVLHLTRETSWLETLRREQPEEILLLIGLRIPECLSLCFLRDRELLSPVEDSNKTDQK
ncbi:hypothetical protein PHYBLDRAFT_66341 [Phycomyces blakesleeanus NRRL 1555(-)]|uniref:Uncharacterized protein n=1 Tax=Phycomyces blakesleeanus (strain ATCC 8743b / DSM 1359 / FGSC 10004 / NBRC 33097 / NRRL 1555) TaxID=763407 RepID=A0A167L2H7_PHYB8|nr:hypothetical protein PHYBLDRAFT_66341 [Phycomyces blakesleeanus NRRL 1555(-)]OAD69438.1 hypothetical protein PHYBLDRAFT_66341 [Phycomyces blakesleeanus NRRL 1555(-)]|eukprot:XP_018287478.1 hypothetical protein PHYBLDRAFT_66341 [Phycomyces blakesleeanus NRRL 1555(-)]